MIFKKIAFFAICLISFTSISQTIKPVKGDCLPEPREIGFDVASSNCFVHDFYAMNYPGETFQWDFTSDGVIDATSMSGSSTTTLPADGSYMVTLIITNKCGSITLYLKYDVDCIPNECDWPKGYGSNTSIVEAGKGVVVDQSGNVFVYGEVHSSVLFEDGSSTSGGGFLAKYDNCGTFLWMKDVTTQGVNYVQMKIDNQGNPMVLATNADSGQDEDITFELTKFANANGAVIWSNTIEQWKFLPMPAFDINMNTNEVYLLANVNKYLRIKQANGAQIVNYTAPVNAYTGYPRNLSYIVKLNSSGNQVWQDHMFSNQGLGALQDVVVAENTNRIYLCGYASDHPHPVGDIRFASNTSLAMAPGELNRLIMMSYTSAGSLLYAKIHHNLKGYQTALQIDYSNQDDQIYLKNFDQIQLFDVNANLLSATTIFGQAGQMYYNQAENYLLTCGTHSCNELKIQKFEGVTNTWTYQVGSCSSKGSAHSVFSDPTSSKIFLTGQYWNSDMTFAPGDVLTLSGGRDAFITKIKDQGTTFVYKSLANEAQNETDVRMEAYPNPVSGLLTIDVNSENKEAIHSIKVYNSMGQEVVNRNFTNTTSFQVDFSVYPSGIYQVVWTDGKLMETKRVVKQ